MLLKPLACIFLVLISLTLYSQSEEDFQAKYTAVFMNLTDTPKAKSLAKEALDMVENTEALQTIGNYSILATIFKTSLGDEETGEYCQKKVNTLISFEVPVADNNTTYQSPLVEWSSKYTMGLFQETDPSYGREALKFLESHPELHKYNFYASVAGFFAKIGDFSKARSLFKKGHDFIPGGEYDVPVLMQEALFYFKSGEYDEVEKLITLNQQLAEQATGILKGAYESYENMIKMFYFLNIGDYYNYSIESEKAYKRLGESTPNPYGADPYLSSLYGNKALSNEVLRNYELASKYWWKADSAALAYYNKIKETYPQYPITHKMMSDEYLAKIGKLENRSEAIRKADEYYEKQSSYSGGSLQFDHQKATSYGFFRDNRYKTLYQSVLNRSNSVRDFSEATRPNTMFAYFQMRDHLYGNANSEYKTLWKKNYEWINDIIFTFGEKAFVSFYNTKLKDGYDNFHTYVKLGHDNKFNNATDLI